MIKTSELNLISQYQDLNSQIDDKDQRIQELAALFNKKLNEAEKTVLKVQDEIQVSLQNSPEKKERVNAMFNSINIFCSALQKEKKDLEKYCRSFKWSLINCIIILNHWKL
jgi:hypothetical protein